MKNILFALLIILFQQPLQAQTILGAPNTLLNPVVINPALTGLRYEDEASGYLNLSSRQQWTNIKDAPKSQILTYDKYFSNSKAGLGVIVHNEQMHIFQQYGVRLGYAYHIGDKETRFSIGASTGFKHQRLDLGRTKAKDLDDMIFNQSIDQSAKTSFDLNTGVNLRFQMGEDNFSNIGTGFSRLLPNTWRDSTALLKNKVNGFFYWRYMPYINDAQTSSLEPVISLFYSSNKVETFSIDLTFRTKFKDSFFNDFFISTGWQTGFMETSYLRYIIGFKLSDHYSIAYNYEKNLSNLIGMPDNIHQIQLQFALGEKVSLK
jgi:type IX secretion system PorP/SprF family membrane protein